MRISDRIHVKRAELALARMPGIRKPLDLRKERRVMEAAREGYDPELPYHNFGGHIVSSMGIAVSLIGGAVSCGVKIDSHAAWHALLFHDALLRGNPDDELRAAEYARDCLEHFGYPEEHVEKVAGIIPATKIGKKVDTPEKMVLRAIDVANIGGPYGPFERNFFALHEEAQEFRGRRIPLEEFLGQACRILSRALSINIHLTPAFYNQWGSSAFHTNAFSNIYRISCRIQERRLRFVGEVGCGANPTILRSGAGDEPLFYVGIDPNEGALMDALFLSYSRAPMHLSFFAPAYGNALPFNSNALHELRFVNTMLHHPDSFSSKEVARVLKRGGIATIAETYTPLGYGFYDGSYLDGNQRGKPIEERELEIILRDVRSKIGPFGFSEGPRFMAERGDLFLCFFKT